MSRDEMPGEILPMTGAWFVKDFADGWIKFYDVKMAINEAQATSAIMLYSPNGKPPSDTSPPAPSAEPTLGDIDLMKRTRTALSYLATGPDVGVERLVALGTAMEAAGRFCEVGNPIGAPSAGHAPIDWEGLHEDAQNAWRLDKTNRGPFEFCIDYLRERMEGKA